MQINNIRVNKHNIAIKCKSVHCNEQIKNALQMSDIYKQNVTLETLKKPSIKIVWVNLDEYFNENTKIEQDIREKNIIAETNAQTKIMNNGKLYIGCKLNKVYDDVNLNICYKCSKFGHLQK